MSGKKTTRYARQRGLHLLPSHAVRQKLQALKGDGLTVNNRCNTRFTAAELDTLLREPRQALQAARQGRATYNDIVTLSSALHKGVAIEDARVILRGFAPIYERANAAIGAIEARCTTTGRWVATALYGHEITALDDLLWAYEQALQVCTYGEFYRRQAVAVSRTASQGLPVFTAGDVLEYPGS